MVGREDLEQLFRQREMYWQRQRLQWQTVVRKALLALQSAPQNLGADERLPDSGGGAE